MACDFIQALHPETALGRTALPEGDDQGKLLTWEKVSLFVACLENAGELVCGHLTRLIEPQPENRLSRSLKKMSVPSISTIKSGLRGSWQAVGVRMTSIPFCDTTMILPNALYRMAFVSASMGLIQP